MQCKQTHIQISDVNQTRLITELEKLVGNLEMDPEQKRALREADLDKKAAAHPKLGNDSYKLWVIGNLGQHEDPGKDYLKMVL